MKFRLVDKVLEQGEGHIRAVKQVSLAEEYLADHFPTFPVLPGVLMVETLVQAARQMLAGRGDGRLVLGEVKAMKFGSFVKPGESLDVRVELVKQTDDGGYVCKGTGHVRRAAAHGQNGEPEVAVSGRFTMRPMRLSGSAPHG